MLGEALLDLARLLVGMDVQRKLLARRVPADLLEPGARAGAHGVGGKADGDAGLAQGLDLVEIGGDRGLAHPVEPAALVGDVEQDERDPGVRRRLGRRKRLGGAEVVELADRRVSGSEHLAVDLGVVAPHRRGCRAVCLLEHAVAPRPEVGSGGTAA